MNQKQKPDLYLSVDVETTGGVPPFHSMLSLGAVPFYRDGRILRLNTFSVNLDPLPFGDMDPGTQQFWNKNQGAYAEATRHPSTIRNGMKAFSDYLDELRRIEDNKHIVFVGYPAVFDFDFVKYYIERESLVSPFGFSALDLKTLGMAIVNEKRFRKAVKKNFPAQWVEGQHQHDHIAVHDAMGQAKLAIEMFKALDTLHLEANVGRAVMTGNLIGLGR